MLTLKEYNIKLARLKNTRKMTKTMQMVSANKLRKAQKTQKDANTFETRLNGIVGRFGGDMSPDDHPLLARHRSVDKVLVVVFTSEKGLCGGFNSGVNRKAMDWMSRNSNKYKRVQMSFCGRKGFLFFKNRFEVASHYEDYALKPKFADALRIGNDLQKAFLSGQFDEIYVAYNALQGTLSYKPEVKKLLPLDTDVLPASPEAGKGMWIMEPSRRKLLLSAIPRVVNLKIYSIMVETAAGEHGARMAAMDNATRNADDLIENITLFRNRARQAKITKELTEIVGGAEALK